MYADLYPEIVAGTLAREIPVRMHCLHVQWYMHVHMFAHAVMWHIFFCSAASQFVQL